MLEGRTGVGTEEGRDGIAEQNRRIKAKRKTTDKEDMEDSRRGGI